MRYRWVEPKKVSLRSHPTYNERWVQERIAADPGLLGLGDLVLKDVERRQSGAGRLDLLLQDPDTTERYEVEIQLGPTDPSHIIRTIEYWDIERRRYPQYEHTAVIVAEDVTSRFMNVISLFSGFIPLIAIQLSAVVIDDAITLIATRVVDQMVLGPEDEEDAEQVDRTYWEAKADMTIPDRMIWFLQDIDPAWDLNFTKGYVGTAKLGVADNIVVFHPRRSHMGLDVRMSRDETFQEEMESAGLDVVRHSKWGRYELRLQATDLDENEAMLRKLIALAHECAIR